MIKKKIWGFIRLLRPEISIFGILCVYIGAIASGSYSFSYELVYGMLAVFFIGAGSMPFNDYFDWEIDKLNHPNRPLSIGLFKPVFGLHTGVIFFIIGLILSFLINYLCFIIASIAIILIIIYEIEYKNKAFIGNIIVAFTTAISFTYGGAILGELIKPTFFTLIIAMIMFFIPSYLGIFSDWYIIFAIPVAIITIYSIILLYKDVNNAWKTANILRITMAAGLIIFIIALI